MDFTDELEQQKFYLLEMSSLYERCETLRQKLLLIQGFDRFLSRSSSIYDLDVAEGKENRTISDYSPVSELWACFRAAEGLCFLINYLSPGTIRDINPTEKAASNINLAKTNLYRFIAGLKKLMPELLDSEETSFNISDVYKDDSNGFVKVVRCVERIVDRLEMEHKIDQNLSRDVSSRVRARLSLSAKSNQDKIVIELLESERKYVADLEKLQHFMILSRERNLLSESVSQRIFGNLNTLLDFQRKFLLIMEQCCQPNVPFESRKIGKLFVSNEEEFKIYGPYCSNNKTGLEMATANAEYLTPLADIIEPKYELQSYLIKPIQRICKYPLLLRELRKHADGCSSRFLQEIDQGFEAASRVASMVNEISRMQENAEIVKHIAGNVQDWKGFEVESFGNLLLHDKVLMKRRDVEREVHMYLFERIVICLREIKKDKKRSLGFRKSFASNRSSHGNPIKYQLKGGVAISGIEGVQKNPKSGELELKIFYKNNETREMENFALKFIHEEPLSSWKQQLDTLVERYRRRSAPIDKHRKSHGSRYTHLIERNTMSSHPHKSMVEPRNKQKYPKKVYIDERLSVASLSADAVSPSTRSDLGRRTSNESSGRLSQTNSDLQTPMSQNYRRPSIKGNYQFKNLDQAIDELGQALKEGFFEEGDFADDEESLSLTEQNDHIGIEAAKSQEASQVKCKARFYSDIFVFFVPLNVSYRTLKDRIWEKIEDIDERDFSKKFLRIKYRDEDGDFISIRGDSDVQVAMKLMAANSLSGNNFLLNLNVEMV